MTTMISEVYDALLDGGTSEEKARRAAETLADYDARLASIDLHIEKLDGRVTLVTWQLALVIGGVATLILKAFAH